MSAAFKGFPSVAVTFLNIKNEPKDSSWFVCVLSASGGAGGRQLPFVLNRRSEQTTPFGETPGLLQATWELWLLGLEVFTVQILRSGFMGLGDAVGEVQMSKNCF